MVMIAKGNRTQSSPTLQEARRLLPRFYRWSGGILAQNNIKSIECVEYPELGDGSHLEN